MIVPKIDTTKVSLAYANAFRRFAKLPGFNQREILRSEVGVILKTWAGRTPAGTAEQADRRTRLRTVRELGYTRADARGDVSVNAGYKNPQFGRVWLKVRKGNGRTKFILAKGANFGAPTGSAVFKGIGGPRTAKWVGNVSDAVADVTSTLPRRIELGRKSLGLARQSVVQIADGLGIDLARVKGGRLSAARLAEARAALASSGRSFRNGLGISAGDETKPYMDLINRLPYGVAIGMDRTLIGVIAGRARFIERSFAKGAFDSQERVAKSFPNLFRFRQRST